MAVIVAEYLGQRTDISHPHIVPVEPRSGVNCPFMSSTCAKVNKAQEPVCSVRETHKGFWIVCEHRLCATKKTVPLSLYQQKTLLSIAQHIFAPNVTLRDIAVKRSVSMPVTSGGDYVADYVMVLDNPQIQTYGPRKVIIEMQGGGETSNTGRLTQFVRDWAKDAMRSNSSLTVPVLNVNSIETNAWRRQQEQFILKGNIARLTGGAIVFCVGKILYQYLLAKMDLYKPRDLKNHAWTLAIVCFDIDETQPISSGPIPLRIDTERLLFTDYINFVQALVAQGEPFPGIFMGEFNTLDGEYKILG